MGLEALSRGYVLSSDGENIGSVINVFSTVVFNPWLHSDLHIFVSNLPK